MAGRCPSTAPPIGGGCRVLCSHLVGRVRRNHDSPRSGSETLPIAIGRLSGRAGALPRAQAFAMATILLVLTTVVVMATGTHERLGADDA